MNSLIKSIAFIGLLMILVSSLYPGANSSWSIFQNTLRSGLTLPAFENPFIGVWTMDFAPVADGTMWNSTTIPDPPAAVFNNNSVADCTISDWWGCVSTPTFRGDFPPDGSDSYVRLTPSEISFSVNMSRNVGDTGSYTMSDVSFRFQCRSWGDHTKPTAIQIVVTQSNGSILLDQIADDMCVTDTFALYNFTIGIDFTTPVSRYSQVGVHFYCVQCTTLGAFLGLGYGYITDVSDIHMYIHYNKQVICSSGITGVGCQVGAFLNTIADIFRYIINGLIWLVSSALSVISFVFNVISGLFIGFTGTLAYFFALPGMPVFLQGIVDVVMIVIIGTVIMTAAVYMVGIIGGVVNKA